MALKYNRRSMKTDSGIESRNKAITNLIMESGNADRSKLRLAAGSSHAQARAAYKKFMQAERISWTKTWQSGRYAARWWWWWCYWRCFGGGISIAEGGVMVLAVAVVVSVVVIRDGRKLRVVAAVYFSRRTLNWNTTVVTVF